MLTKTLKKIKELEQRISFYMDKTDKLNSELNIASSQNYKYRKLFSDLFSNQRITNVKSYNVLKRISDGEVLFEICYEDGSSYTYSIKLTSTSNLVELGGNDGQTK